MRTGEASKNRIGNFFSELWASISKTYNEQVTARVDSAKATVEKGLKTAYETGVGAVDAAAESVAKVHEGVVQGAVRGIEGTVQVAKKVWDTAGEIKDATGKAAEGVGTAMASMGERATDAVGRAWAGVIEGGVKVAQATKETVVGAVDSTAESVARVHQEAVQGVAWGIEWTVKTAQAVWAKAGEVYDATGKAVKGAGEAVASINERTFNAVWEAGAPVIEGGVKFAKATKETVVGAVDAAKAGAKEGAQMVADAGEAIGKKQAEWQERGKKVLEKGGESGVAYAAETPLAKTHTDQPQAIVETWLQEKTVKIEKGQTLSAIAGETYGDRNLGMKLAEYNKVDPAKLKIGQEIKLPTKEVLLNQSV